MTQQTAKFPLGRVVATANFLETLTEAEEDPWKVTPKFLARHQQADWGDVDAADKGRNDQALIDGERLLSSYTTEAGVKFWIITEWDRSVTTFLLPEDY